MEIAVFVIMILITLAALGYPLWRRPAVSAEAFPSAVEKASMADSIGADRLAAELTGLVCANCGRALKSDERFCPGCGTPAGERCSHCGRTLDGDELFCPGCGTKTGQA